MPAATTSCLVASKNASSSTARRTELSWWIPEVADHQAAPQPSPCRVDNWR